MLSFWQKDLLTTPADVVIVGAGFAGLWCAYELKKRKPELVIKVLNNESFPGGASVRNAGFACFGSPGEMITDATKMGEEAMWKVVAKRYHGIQKLRAVLGDASIDYDACGGYECFSDYQQVELIFEKLDWLNAGMKTITGESNVFSVANEKLSSLGLTNFQYLIANYLEGGIHSGKAIEALIQKLTTMGVKFLFGIDVKQWQKNGDNIFIDCNAGESFTLKTKQLLIATNAFTQSLVKDFPVQPARGQVLVTAPIEGLQLNGTFHFDEGYYYWRNVGNRILLGGARNTAFEQENTWEIDTSETVQNVLKDFLFRHIQLPSNNIKIEHRWAGIMGFTQNKMPQIIQSSSNVWSLVACNGMGVALTPVIAEDVADLMLT